MILYIPVQNSPLPPQTSNLQTIDYPGLPFSLFETSAHLLGFSTISLSSRSALGISFKVITEVFISSGKISLRHQAAAGSFSLAS